MNPCLVLARELAERGHSVFFITQEEARSWIAHPGIRHLAWEPPWTGRNGERFLEHLHAVRGAMSEEPDERRRLALSARSAAEVYTTAFDSLREIVVRIAPDILIVPEFLGLGWDIGHALGCPLILVAPFLP